MSIAIIGSSPVCYIYAILLSNLDFQSTIYTGLNKGGAWNTYLYKNSINRSFSTHILMYSKGLNKTLNSIKYSPQEWELSPILVDENLNVIKFFGSSKEGYQFGAPMLNDSLINFLKKKVKNINKISIKENCKINDVIIKKSNSDFLKKEYYVHEGIIFTAGCNINLFIDKNKIQRHSKKNEVRTISLLISFNEKLKSTFIHLLGEKTLIREIEIIPIDKTEIEILCKISSHGKSFKESDLIKAIKKYMFNFFKAKIKIIEIKYFCYENNRYLFDLNNHLYNSLPLIIPGVDEEFFINKKKFYKESQDLSLIFKSYSKIIEELSTKFKISNQKVFIN